MLEIYYVNRNKDNQGNNEVHRDSCGFLPHYENREYIGWCQNSYEAVLIAKQKYPKADGCWHCCPESHNQ